LYPKSIKLLKLFFVKSFTCFAYFHSVYVLKFDCPGLISHDSPGRSYKRSSSSVGFGQIACDSNSGGNYNGITITLFRTGTFFGIAKEAAPLTPGQHCTCNLQSSRPLLSTQMKEETITNGSAVESPGKTKIFLSIILLENL
jgi:hypothetical protein